MYEKKREKMMRIKLVGFFALLFIAAGCSPINNLTTWSKAVRPGVSLNIGEHLVATPPPGDWRFEVYIANNFTGRLGSNYDKLQHGKLYLNGCYEKGISQCSFQTTLHKILAGSNDRWSITKGVLPPNVEASEWFRGMVTLADFQAAITEIPDLGEYPGWVGLYKKAADIYQFGSITCLQITESTHSQRIIYQCPIADALGDINYVLAVTYNYHSSALSADQAMHMLKKATQEFLRSMTINIDV